MNWVKEIKNARLVAAHFILFDGKTQLWFSFNILFRPSTDVVHG